MSAAARPPATAVTVEPLNVRGGPSYSSPSRSHSTRSRPAAVQSSPNRVGNSRSSSRHAEDPRHSHRADRAHAPPAPVNTPRRSSSDRPATVPARSDSARTSGAHHSRHHSRTSSRSKHSPLSNMSATTAVANGGGPAPIVTPTTTSDARHTGAGRPSKSRTTIPAQTGNWVLGKTIGAGSMGKVKLARRLEGGEQVAVKIVPRGCTEDSHNQSRADRERADHSKEVRTAREAAIVTLLDHPYICSMRDVVRTNYHWYMLFEYVNGGQMLDYIISHGRLKEKPARKFSRQIASALDYCHRNSIVHRDLKIENILISKTGDIKIIDFGLSNLFAPKGHLKTFCGSLYFAAPELLQAKAYQGPEVDVWSFGIVLYVLVCGKVPFDDQSMPALHAKIKKGVVDYPNWLSAECKNLISRMLVTDPTQRASLQEIMNHPWMIKGYGAAPENHLPVREPLQMPLDPEVIHAMTGFDFGPPEIIHTQLSRVVESEEYQRAVRIAAREKEAQAPKDSEKKRGFGFDFYKRRNSTTSRDTLTTTPSTEALQLGNDPVNAYDPLISVYYLVKEKQERDRQAANPGATSMPRAPGEAPLQMPEISAPQAAYTNATPYEMPGEKATGGRSRPRARTHGENDVTDAMKHVKIAGSSGPISPAIVEPEQQAKKESTTANILRRFSTRRRKEDRPDRSHPPMVKVQSPGEVPRKSFSVRGSRDRSRDGDSRVRSGSSQPHSDLLSPPQSEPTQGKGLGRSTSVNSADYRRQHERGTEAPPRVTYKDPPPLTSGSDKSRTSGQVTPEEKSLREAEQKTSLKPKAGTMRTKSLGHARRESIQARRAKREEAREAGVPEGSDADLGEGNISGPSTERVDNAEHVKPVFLKGLFSVSTTSTRPVHVIRADIIRVLRQLGVDFSEIRGGFSCRKVPSIDLKKVVDPPHSPQTPGHNRRISFGGLMGNKDVGRGDEFRETDRLPQTPRTSRRANHDASYGDSDESAESVAQDPGSSSRREIGATSTHVQSELGGSMVLEFEIFIVKVPLLSLHGIQFKRLAGGTWQYKNMADQILKELKL